MTATGTETSTLMGTQNQDNVNITGGTIAGTSITGGTVTGAVISGGTINTGAAAGRYGTFVANGTTAVTISSASLLITDVIAISLNTVGGTVGVQPHVATIAAGQASIVCTASDTSTYNYVFIKTA